jgi:hypothetical protein
LCYFGLISSSLTPLYAQGMDDMDVPATDDAPVTAPTRPAMPGGANILQVDAQTLANLPGLLAQNRADAVSLSVSLEELQDAPEADSALQAWVRDGGVVFLHTSAAQLFGYRTVVAREATNRRAGQLFGRARAALSFAAHPLLWGSVATPNLVGSADAGPVNPAASVTPSQSTLGVDLVFYQMRPGDHLVQSHPGGVPLLRVTDLTAPVAAPDLYAAAVAPFGRGWAIFTPDFIETQRADGAIFVRNLMRMALSSRTVRGASPAVAPNPQLPALQPNTTALVSIPASVIEGNVPATDGEGDAVPTFSFSALAQAATRAVRGGIEDTDPETNLVSVAPRLILTRGEMSGLAGLAGAANADANARAAATAVLYILRARLALQRNDVEAASEWMEQARTLSSRSAETALWSGVIAASRAADLTLSSRDRAGFFAQAVQYWTAALSAPPLMRGTATTAQTTTSATATAISGVPRTLLQAWARDAQRTANLMSVEPPFVTPLGNGAGSILLRHYPEDPTLRLALPTGATLSNSVQLFGWRPDDEEILIFTTPAYFQNYRRAAGLTGETVPNPLQRFGDIAGNRILMVSQITVQVFLPPATPGGPRRPVQLGTAVPAVIGRLHGEVLVNSLAAGGTPVPGWLRLGLVSLSNQSVVGTALGAGANGALLRIAAANGLLSPQQFDEVINSDVQGVAEAQAQLMMLYFYNRFGAGRVAETLQRLGSGQTVDEALQATTDMTEAQFFVAWRDAEFGAALR